MVSKQWLTTGIGSTPFQSMEQALAHVTQHYDIPFYPQLINASNTLVAPMFDELLSKEMGEALLAKNTEGFISALALAAETPGFAERHIQALPGIDEFFKRTQKSHAIKLQCIGPLSFNELARTALGLPNARSIEAYAWKWISQVSVAWIKTAKNYSNKRIILLWDDILLANSKNYYIYDLFAVARDEIVPHLRSIDGSFGIHSCAPGTLKDICLHFPRTVLAIDVTQMDCFSPEAVKAAKDHAESGGEFIFGIVNTQNEAIDINASKALLERLKQTFSDQLGHRPIMVSGGCGTGHRTEDFEMKLSDTLRG